MRLHFIDLFAPRGIIDRSRDDSRTFDSNQLDRLDFLVAEFKKRGIYVDLNLNVGRSYKQDDGVTDHDRIRWDKGLVLFDPRLIELQKEYARQILTHKNPYTGTEYRNEPAVAIVEILNENALYMGYRAPTPFYDEQLTAIYNLWLAKRNDVPAPRLKGPEVAAASHERFHAEMAFYSEMEDRFYQDMTHYLRKELGVRVPITGTADHSHTGSSYPMLATLSRLDIMDGHTYWQHPGSRVMNTPMVNDPFNSTVVKLSRTAFAGKPYTVSEVNHPFPNEWASEGIPILAAYASLQDWDAIFLYTFEPKRAADWPPYVGDPFDISLDPVRMTQMASGSLMFLRGDVRAARKTIVRSYSREQVVDSRRLPPTESPYFTPGFPLALPLTHTSRIGSLNGAATPVPTLAAADPIVSDTGELAWHRAEGKYGVVTVETERTQALIGFLAANPKSTKNLSARIETPFAALVLVSLDEEPISRSSRLL
ncbi:MAG: hypothetical protein JJE04_17350 [Acidobacteriia bacterium]|nr:hypothetical protein [Terriglobia bacterium]